MREGFSYANRTGNRHISIFAICVVLMMTRKLPTILGTPHHGNRHLPGGRHPVHLSPTADFTIANDVTEAGAMRMSTAIAGLIFGGFGSAKF